MRTKIIYLPVDEISARIFLHWVYEHPYDVYNYAPNNFEKDLAYSIDPKNNMYSMYRDGKLIGYCSFGRDAQVPGGDYSEEAIDIGLMIKPSLTGHGMGSGFVRDVIGQALGKYNPGKLRVTIFASNSRALKVWEKNGFVRSQSFIREHGSDEFFILTRTV